MSIPRIITDTSVTVILDGNIYMADSTHPSFTEIRQCVMNQEFDGLADLFDVASAIARWSDNEFVVEDNRVTYQGERLPDVLEKRIIGFYGESAPFEHLLAFYRRLQANPSARSVETLYSFLEHENIPVGEDGCFYAYKAVRGNWYDCYSGKCFNGIGSVLAMPRNKVNDDPRQGCSYGYHVGSLNYASNFKPGDGRLLIVKVDPADVVAVPYDCAFQKVRTAKYVVVSEYTGPLPSTFIRASEVDDGFFPTDFNQAQGNSEQSRLQNEIDSCDDELLRLLTALEAAEDAGLGNTYLEGIANAINSIESRQIEFENLLEDLLEGEKAELEEEWDGDDPSRN